MALLDISYVIKILHNTIYCLLTMIDEILYQALVSVYNVKWKDTKFSLFYFQNMIDLILNLHWQLGRSYVGWRSSLRSKLPDSRLCNLFDHLLYNVIKSVTFYAISGGTSGQTKYWGHIWVKTDSKKHRFHKIRAFVGVNDWYK